MTPTQTTTAVLTICPCCDTEHTLELDTDGYFDWHEGDTPLPDALPGLSEDDRERLITGTCPTCWDQLFGALR